MKCQYIIGNLKPNDGTVYLEYCKSIAVDKLDIEGLNIEVCSKHSKEIVGKMRVGGKEVVISKITSVV